MTEKRVEEGNAKKFEYGMANVLLKPLPLEVPFMVVVVCCVDCRQSVR